MGVWNMDELVLLTQATSVWGFMRRSSQYSTMKRVAGIIDKVRLSAYQTNPAIQGHTEVLSWEM